MSESGVPALDAEAIYRGFADRAAAWLRGRDLSQVGLVGIHTGGVWLAERLAAEFGIATPVGVLDVAFYRDDFAASGLKPLSALKITFQPSPRSSEPLRPKVVEEEPF